MSRTILVTGCFHSLNSGVMAMVESVVQNVGASRVYILSSERYYDTDQERYGIYDQVELVKTPWRSGSRIMKVIHLFLSMFGITLDKEFRNVLKNTDLLVDISGDTISSDYGTFGIVLSSAHFFVAKSFGIEIVLGPQTLGPFEGFLQNYFAKRIFKVADKIFVREKESFQFINKFDNQFDLVADLAFILNEKKPDEEVIIPENTIAFGVSGLLVSKNNTDTKLYEKVMELLLSKGYNVLLVTHVNLPNADDLQIGREIKEKYKENSKVIFAGKNFRASEWKYIISHCKGIISGRMHPIVLGLSKLVPALNLSYNHKSKGVVENRFSPYGSLADTRNNSSEELLSKVENFLGFIESENYSIEEFKELRDKNEALSRIFIDRMGN